MLRDWKIVCNTLSAVLRYNFDYNKNCYVSEALCVLCVCVCAVSYTHLDVYKRQDLDTTL